MPSIVIACQKCEACLRENGGNCTSCQDMQEIGGAEEKRARERERDRERSRRKRAKIDSDHRAVLNFQRRENHAALSKDKKNADLLKRKEKYATMPEEKKQAVLTHDREKKKVKYANMTESEKAALLLHSREKYAKLTPKQRSIKLKIQRETYAKVKCPIEREAFLARVRTAMRESREAYTTEQMLRETERNAERQREIRLRVTIRDDINRELLPPGRMCNIDCWDLSSIRYFDVGGLSVV